jgi:hypothetical protein
MLSARIHRWPPDEVKSEVETQKSEVRSLRVGRSGQGTTLNPKTRNFSPGSNQATFGKSTKNRHRQSSSGSRGTELAELAVRSSLERRNPSTDSRRAASDGGPRGRLRRWASGRISAGPDTCARREDPPCWAKGLHGTRHGSALAIPWAERRRSAGNDARPRALYQVQLHLARCQRG